MTYLLKKKIMELGSITNINEERVFLLSTTHGAEAHGLAAALAVIQTYRDNDVIGHQTDEEVEQVLKEISELGKEFEHQLELEFGEEHQSQCDEGLL